PNPASTPTPCSATGPAARTDRPRQPARRLTALTGRPHRPAAPSDRPPAPLGPPANAMKPRIHGVRTHWNPGFMASGSLTRSRRTRRVGALQTLAEGGVHGNSRADRPETHPGYRRRPGRGVQVA